MNMHAAVVRSFDQPPRYESVPVPRPTDPDHTLVDVLAAGLHPRVRSGASGSHYASTGALPMIPGIDGVGRLADGQTVYFVAPDDVPGSMAERAVIDVRRTVALPDGTDVMKIAAGMNPAMSAWVALRRRVPLQPGQSVLILGATGNAGQMAVQVAKRLGAGRVVGAGRDAVRLAALPGIGADDAVALTDTALTDTALTDTALADDAASTAEALAGAAALAGAEALAGAAADVDIVIDYLWGAPAAAAMMTLLKARADRTRELNWIQIGAMAGPTIELPSVALRSANLRLQGNGQGAVSPRAYLAELPSLIDEINAGTIGVTARVASLADVTSTWTTPDVPGIRTVLVP